MKYNKLIRDKVVELIESKGEKAIFHIAEDEEYKIKLKEKLLEEVNEFLLSEDIGEIADILEVLEAICDYKKFRKEEVEEIKKKKAYDRGVFKKKIILDES